jgi:catechol 2,3-dioxygenase-like lactoylglutathione lyase family enzyme
MVRNGIDRIQISVRDLKESVAFFRDTLEMTLAAEGELDPGALGRLYGLEGLSAARAAWLKNAEQPTLIELIQITPNSGKFIREGARHHDIGLFDVAFRAKDIDSIYADLKGRGFEFISAPVVYTADWAKVTVKEVILIGPNRMPIAFIERLSEPKPVIAGRFGTLVDCAQFTTDWEETLAFYTGLLGYKSVFDSDLPDGLIDGVLDLPPRTKSRMAFLLMPPAPTPAVELIRCLPPGKSLAAAIRPENIGLFGLAFRVEDLEAFLVKVKGAGYRVAGGPLALDHPARGRLRAAVVRGPNGSLLEFHESR